MSWGNHGEIWEIDHIKPCASFDLTDKKLVLCGNYGDPIYHPDFINFVKQLKARGAVLSITTNGSYKTQDWW